MMKAKMTEQELRKLDAREIKGYYSETKNAEYLGSIMGAYGDYNYYRMADGTYAFSYFSIGD